METRPVVGYEEYYSITDSGMVYSNISHKYLVPYIDRYGYKAVSLKKDGIKKNKTIHRLVAQAFIPNPSSLPIVNHIDENKQNNDVNNLEWCTVEYNNNYGTRVARTANTRKGNKNIYRRKVVCVDKINTKIIIFPSIQSTECFGFDESRVAHVCYHDCKTHKGCQFVFYEDWIRGDTNELPRNKN